MASAGHGAKAYCAVAVAAHLLLCRAAIAAPPGWELSWSDEFSGAALDTVKWRAWQPSTPGPYNEERQEYLPSQVAVTGGNLVITATNQPYSSQYGSYDYRSGRVESNFGQRHGRFEIRADLPGTKGTWPALWLLPDVNQYSWPTQGEIDILENKGHQGNLTSSAFHFRLSGQHQYVADERTAARFGQAENYHNSFHTYAVEWDATKIRYFVDDVHWYTTYNAGAYAGTNGVTVNGFLAGQSAPMQVVLNLAVGGQFLGSQQPDATSVWPQQLLVDYVRIFTRDENPARLQNGGFEKNNGGLGGWTVFGNRLNTNNVQVHNEAVADGVASAKLFGQFIGSTNSSGISQGITVAPGDEVQASIESFIRSQDSIAGTSNAVQMKIEFYNLFGGLRSSSAFINETVITIANSSSPNNVWRQHELSGMAPAGAVEARLVLAFTQAANGGGAIHLDNAQFRNTNIPDVADADADGDVDGADFLVWQSNRGSHEAAGPTDGDFNFDGSVDEQDLNAWQLQSTPPQGTAVGEESSLQAPEPSAAVLTLTTLVGLLGARSSRCSVDIRPTSAA
jgi:beta-glucanase (GH16 family)